MQDLFHYLSGGLWGLRFFNGSTILLQILLFAFACALGVAAVNEKLVSASGQQTHSEKPDNPISKSPAGTRRKIIQWSTVGLLALDPCTGLLCRSIMSEAVCLALLLVVLAGVLNASREVVREERGWKQLVLWGVVLGVILGIAYLVRYSALLLIPALIAYWFLLRKLQTGWIWKGLGLLIGFQLLLLPVRMVYKVRYDTFSLNAFTGYSLWNTAAYLIPDAKLKKPIISHRFNHHLHTYPDQTYEMEVTWNTAHIYGPGTPAYDYLQTEDPPPNAFHFSRQLRREAIRLIGKRPFHHMKSFWIPNFLRPFQQSENIHYIIPSKWTRAGSAKATELATSDTIYRRELWWLGFLVLLGLTAAWFFPRFRSRELGLLILFVWGYLLAVDLTAVFFLRFVYFLAPILILGVGKVLLTEKLGLEGIGSKGSNED